LKSFQQSTGDHMNIVFLEEKRIIWPQHLAP